LRQWKIATGKELPGYFASSRGRVRPLAYTTAGVFLHLEDDADTIRFWDPLQTWDWPVRKLPADVGDLLMSPDGTMIAHKTKDGRTIHVVDTASGREIHRFLSEKYVYGMIFSPDGRTLAFSDDQITQVWDTTTGRKLLEKESTPLVLSPDGKRIACVRDHRIHIWDVATGADAVNVPRLQAVTALHFSPDGQTLTTGGSDGSVHLWQTPTGKQIRSALARGRAIAFSSNGKVVATIPEGSADRSTTPSNTLCLFEANTGKQLHLLKQEYSVRGIAFAPDGSMVAVPEACTPGLIRLWNATTGKEVYAFGPTKVGPGMGIRFTTLPVAFSPDGKTLACGHRDGTIRLWDPATGQERLPSGKRIEGQRRESVRVSLGIEIGGITCLTYSPDGKKLAAAKLGDACPIQVWDLASGESLRFTRDQPPRLLNARFEDGWVNALAFSPDGRTLASTKLGKTAITLWDVATGRERQRLQGHRAEVLCLVFSPNGKLLASGSQDGTALIWDIKG
jgi:WD40 repeat protein